MIELAGRTKKSERGWGRSNGWGMGGSEALLALVEKVSMRDE